MFPERIDNKENAIKKSKERIVITGVTGLLGSNLLFEILKRNIDDLENINIFVLGRGRDNMDIEHRVRCLLREEGLSYLGVGEEWLSGNKSLFSETIRCMNLDLDCDDLGLSADDHKELSSYPIDVFFHIAALTDFRNTPQVIRSLRKTNVLGTERVIKLANSIDLKQFCYAGSAYSCGEVGGKISPDYTNCHQNFRNPYEATKLEAEMMVRFFEKESGVKCKIFRVSTICGRLIEEEIGLVNKFDVFYAWAAFFLRVKMKYVEDTKEIYNIPVHMDARILYSSSSGLNIVPADYAAKVIYQSYREYSGSGSYHIVNDTETPHVLYVPLMLETLNIKGVYRVDSIPADMNRLEELYYKTVGKIYSPYVIADDMLFDTSNLTNVLGASNLLCPQVDKKGFTGLMRYARKKNFGLF